MTTFAYIRVSSKDQNEDRQLLALEGYNIPKKNMFIDKKSGKDFERPAYRRLLRKLNKGDLLIIKSIDRLGRNYTDVIEQWRVITKEKGADIRVLDMPLLDTTIGKDVLGTFIADLVLQVLSYSAHSERESIRQRQAEGIAAAKMRGVRFGRQRKPLPENFEQLYLKWEAKELSVMDFAKACDMSRATLYKHIRNRREGQQSLGNC